MRFSNWTTRRLRRQDTTACLEVGRSHLRLAVVRNREDGQRVVVDDVRWRGRSTSLLTEQGAEELRIALEQLAAKHDLRGRPLRAAISGDLCVSRIVIGDEQRVEQELEGFESRSQRYLTLGHGRKIHAVRIDHGDSQSYYGTLGVANRRTVKAIQSAADAAGLQLEGIEPSIVSISRLVGREKDEGAPVLLACLDGDGLEFGVCQQGRTVAQFRPTKGYRPEQLPLATSLHFPRLKRQCSHSLGVGKENDLQLMLLVGSTHRVERAAAHLTPVETSLLKLSVDALDPMANEGLLDHRSVQHVDDEEPVDGRYAAVLGLTCLESEEAFGPNMLVALDDDNRDGWMTKLRRHWAAAAIAIVAIGFQMAGYYISHEVVRLQEVQQGAQGVQGRLASARQETALLKKRIARFESLDMARRRRAMGHLAEQIGMCLPETLWLTDLQADYQGVVSLRGVSQLEAAIYETVELLRDSPALSQLTINKTTATDLMGLVNFEMRGSRTEPGEANNEED